MFGKTFDEHLSRLAAVLQRFHEASLKLKPEKCNFFETEVKFLRHVLTPEGVLPDPENVKKILQWPEPKNVTDVRGLLSMGNYYRRFIRGYSEKVQHLVQLTKKETAFKWDPECKKAMQTLKEVLVGPDILAYLEDEGEYILDTDASLETIGAVLSQVQNGHE